MKPDTRTAMYNLIQEIKAAVPLELDAEEICQDGCQGCSSKLLEYLQSELVGWELRLEQGEIPNFGDISRLATTGRRIHTTLQKNGVIEAEDV